MENIKSFDCTPSPTMNAVIANFSSGISRVGNRESRAGLGRANSGSGQNRVWPKLTLFFRAKILTAQPALKTGPVGPNSLLKEKKNSGGQGRAWPYRAGTNLARFFSGQ